MTPITVYAPGNYDMADSYGLIACQLARHLSALGVHVNAVGMGKTVMDSQPDDIRAVTSRPIIPSLGGIVLGYPTGYAQHGALLHAGPRIAITMFESTKLPADWIDPLNDMHAVVVPSKFCCTVFRDSGVTVPIHVVPLGIGDSYVYRERGNSNEKIENRAEGDPAYLLSSSAPISDQRPLTFLAFLDRGERKGGIVALQAFLHAFGEDMRYKLVLKGRTPKVPFTLTNPNLEVILRDMSEQELYDLYCRCDVLINPHKGEGFGLIPREFAASGGLALTTGWSGTVDHIGEWGYALPYKLETAHWRGNKTLAGQDLGQWAAVDPRALALELQTVAATWAWSKQLLPAKAQAARSRYSWRTFAERVLGIWKEAAYGNRIAAAAA